MSNQTTPLQPHMSPFPPQNPSGSGGNVLMDIVFVVVVIIVCFVVGYFILREEKE